jgi:hypothetical protein
VGRQPKWQTVKVIGKGDLTEIARISVES